MFCVDTILVCQHKYCFHHSLHVRENLKTSYGDNQRLPVTGSP